MLNCPRYLHSLFCDDVRMELGGKMTFVGVYQSEMIVQPDGPGVVSLAKLCIVVTAQTPKTEPFESLTFKLFRDDEVLQTIEMPSENLKALSTLGDKTPEGAFQSIGAIISLQPFAVDKSCILRVRAETGSEGLASSGLRIVLQPPLPQQAPK